MNHRENGASSIGDMHERAIASGREVRVIKKKSIQNREAHGIETQTVHHPTGISAESVSIPVKTRVLPVERDRKPWQMDRNNIRRKADPNATQGTLSRYYQHRSA